MGLGVTSWDWAIFVTAVVIFLLLDLGVFHRKAHEVKFKEALAWSTLWFVLAFVFAFLIAPRMADNWTSVERNEFITGYIIELSLSMDNVFVIALIFQYFAVPLRYQHRVLFWGILGALVMRGLMIWLGTGRLTDSIFCCIFWEHFCCSPGSRWCLRETTTKSNRRRIFSLSSRAAFSR